MECKDCPNRKSCRHQCMDLPVGKTCGDCVYYNHCTVFYGVKANNTKCDFEPIRFKAKPVGGSDHAD